ncbi:MAG: hypothetical protein ABJA49_12850 [Betaproteobacteria bacterium]
MSRCAGVWPVGGKWLLALACAVTWGAAHAQWTSNRGYQLLQRIDDVLFGIDNLSLEILDRDHVAGTLLRINVDKPYPLRGQTHFVVDCRKPIRMAQLTGKAGARIDPDKLEYADVTLLDGSWAGAEFACESTRQPGRASQVARRIYERGGPDDMQTLYCDLQPDGSTEVRHGVEVRYSASASAVAVNQQWLSSGSVNDEEVRFGINSQWRINRKALDIRRSAAGGEMLFSGLCDRRPPAQR